MGMQPKVHPTHKTDRLMAMACLELQRHGRVRWFFYHHPHTVLALVLVFAVGVFAPGVASSQDATIAGTVTDATGGILPGVAVEARDAAGTAQVRTLTEITLLCAERPKPQKTGSAWIHVATLYRSLS